MDVEKLSPTSRELLLQALPEGELVNVLFRDGARDETGFVRDRRCFALGERGWLDFMGWEGEGQGADYRSRWHLTRQAQALLSAEQ
jgi:hypothetical protein